MIFEWYIKNNNMSLFIIFYVNGKLNQASTLVEISFNYLHFLKCYAI